MKVIINNPSDENIFRDHLVEFKKSLILENIKNLNYSAITKQKVLTLLLEELKKDEKSAI